MDELVFVAGSHRDFGKFPSGVQELMLHGLTMARTGRKHVLAKPLKGFPGAKEIEIPYPHRGDAYRLVYTTRFDGVVYVLHAFKKKSTKGIATPKKEIDLVRARLKLVHENWRDR